MFKGWERTPQERQNARRKGEKTRRKTANKAEGKEIKARPSGDKVKGVTAVMPAAGKGGTK